MNVLVSGFDHRELDDELRADAELAFRKDGAVMVFHNLFHVGQAQPKAFHIVQVARVHPIEFLKDTFEVIFGNANAIILD